MSKKVFLASTILFGLMFFLSPVECFADAAGLLQQAETYANNGYWPNAKQIYRAIVADYPATDYALKAEAELISMSAKEVTNEQIQADIDRLTANYAGYSALPEKLCDIAASCGWASKYEKAEGLYKQIIQQFSDSSVVSRAQLGLLRINSVSLIESGDYPAAAEKMDRMVQEFSGHPDLPVALYHIAKRYKWSERYEEAKAIQQQLTQQYPDSSQAGRVRLDALMTDILALTESGQTVAAQAAMEKLIASFDAYQDVYAPIFQASEQFYARALEVKSKGLDSQAKDYFQKAVTIWEIGVNKLPNFAVLPGSCCWAGDSYRELGEYEKSIACFEKVISDHPDYEFVWHALFTIGQNYESLGQSGSISQSEAETKIKAAYQLVLEKYPGCPVAEYVQSWMANNL